MDGIVDKIIGTYTQDNKNRITNIVDSINTLSKDYLRLKDSDFKKKTEEFKQRLKNGETKKDIMIEAISLCRAAIYRIQGLYPYNVQIEAAVAMQDNVVAEMKTGEGKTLVQMLAAYLNALDGKGVHIVTANDYLAGRDYEQNKKVFEFLGLSVGLVQAKTSKDKKKEEYGKDILYSTIKTISFDYLRDNTVKNKMDRVITKPFNYIVIDEVDSILIDEATTPIILSPGENSEYKKVADLDEYLKYIDMVNNDKLVGFEAKKPITSETATQFFEENPNIDYVFCRWDKSIHLSPKYIGNKTLENVIIATYFFNDKENYVLSIKTDQDGRVCYDKDGKIIKKITVIDLTTGRIAASKKYMNGIQQAIEAREIYKSRILKSNYSVEFSDELVSLGICTYVDVLGMYESGVCGMTGTSSEILSDIYNLQTYQVPTRKRNIRIDKSKVYITKEEKYEAIINDIEECYKIGRPVLIGTTSVNESLEISKMLEKRGIIHNVLNAENEEIESSIIANAGQFGSVTVSTNMAGRGTDIKLGEGVAEIGGLHVIGTTRNRSLRLDNQLRGRSSRQGDPGSATYYSSLEDERVFKFTGNLEYYSRLKEYQRELVERRTGKKVTDKSIETDLVDKAQKTDETLTTEMIREVIYYKNSLVKQRKDVYAFRNKILDTENITDLIIDIIKEDLKCIDNLDELYRRYGKLLKIDGTNIDECKEYILLVLSNKVKSLSTDGNYQEDIRGKMLKILDDYWIAQMQMLEYCRSQWLLETIDGKDPLMHYDKRAYELYLEMISLVYNEIIVYSLYPYLKYGDYVPENDPKYEEKSQYSL